MANEQKLTAQQRAALFGAATRQHFQMIGTKTITEGAQNVVFEIPKARIMQGCKILVKGCITCTATSNKDILLESTAPYRILRRINTDFNNGFSNIVASGEDIALLNMISPNPGVVLGSESDDTLCYAPKFTAKSSGQDNYFDFMLDVPLTLNERDPVGLVLAQSTESTIQLGIDVGYAGDVVSATDVTVALKSLSISVMVTSFSIPNNPNFYPDMSVLKIVDSRRENINSAGINHIKLPCGMIYRKILLKLEDSEGNPMTIDKISSNFELVLNTADIPYSISPEMLRYVNKAQIGTAMPAGVFFFDFSYQGISNYGGSRDYIDSGSIAEMVLRFTSATAGKITIVTEQLSRLI